MTIKLPYIDPIDTLALPEDFEEQINQSFTGFMKDSDYDDEDFYVYEAKLLYLDALRMGWIHQHSPRQPLSAFYDDCYEKNECDNRETMKAIAKIIQVVMNW